MSSTRQLAAIMFTDIVGYTTLMGSNESMAMELVRKNREVQKPLVNKYGGTWLKEMGDGAMSSFPTATDAIYCAQEIQEALHDDKQLNLRIGIHLGEIIMEVGDVYGDGVNIASRLQTIADPGGIYISDTVQKSVRSNGAIQTAYLGEMELKNVDYPVKTYALRGENLPQPKKTEEKHLSGRLIAELQRRNVIRAELAYLAIAFIVYSLLNFVDIDPTLENVIYGCLILGIPLSLYLAWNYERSPQGFVRVTSRKAWINPYSDTQKKPFTGTGVIIILLLIIVGIVVYPLYNSNNTGQADSKGITAISNKKSIAVLPFENLSNDPEQQYFSDGIQEDILNHLAKIGDLKVKSRSSTLQYRENRPGIPQIGRELGVGTILEGSVRKSGNMVRINAQLIDVETDDHIWSETYDREITQVFAIQSEVAKEIAKILELKLSSGNVDLFATGTQNITAYDYFLRAREMWNSLNFGETSDIIKLLQRAISLDPEFAEAHALLSSVLYMGNWDFPKEIYIDSALALANKAIKLDGTNPYGYLARGRIMGQSLKNRKQQGLDLEKAFDLDPNNPDVLDYLGWYLIQNGDPSRGAPMIAESIELNWNRKDPQYFVEWGEIYEYAGEWVKARDLYIQAINLAPEWVRPLNELASLYQTQGDYLRAAQYYTEAENYDGIGWSNFRAGNLENAEEAWLRMLAGESEFEDSTSYVPVRHRLGMIYWQKGEKEKSMKLFEEQMSLNQRDMDEDEVPVWGRNIGTSVYDLAITKSFIGDTEEALDLIERDDFYWGNIFWFSDWLQIDPMLEPVREEPRFQKVLKKWQRVSSETAIEFRKIITEKEASEQLKVSLDK